MIAQVSDLDKYGHVVGMQQVTGSGSYGNYTTNTADMRTNGQEWSDRYHEEHQKTARDTRVIMEKFVTTTRSLSPQLVLTRVNDKQQQDRGSRQRDSGGREQG